MYQNLDLGFLIQKPRQNLKLTPDPFALQPWDQYTFDNASRQNPQKRNYKTFYHNSIFQQQNNKGFLTQRGFTYTKQRQFRAKNIQRSSKIISQDKTSVENISQPSTVSHYNINGNFFNQNRLQANKKYSKTFFLRNSKNKRRQYQSDVIVGVASLNQIKKRVGFSKQISSKQKSLFVKLNFDGEYFQDQSQKKQQNNFNRVQQDLCDSGPIKAQKQLISMQIIALLMVYLYLMALKFAQASMKRCGTPLGDPHPLRKEYCMREDEGGEMSYKLRMLRNWQISAEAARYLQLDGKIKENRVSDFTCPQLCLMVYSPNVYQQMIKEISEFDEERFNQGMDIETVEVLKA